MEVISSLIIIVGLIGVILPIVPGVPLVYAGLLLYGLTERPPELTPTVLIVFGLLALASLAVDWFGQFLGAKKGKATPAGIKGGLIGLAIGILFAPLGGLSIILLPALGVIIGELISGRSRRDATQAGIWTLLGNVFALVTNLLIAGAMIAWFIRAVL